MRAGIKSLMAHFSQDDWRSHSRVLDNAGSQIAYYNRVFELRGGPNEGDSFREWRRRDRWGLAYLNTAQKLDKLRLERELANRYEALFDPDNKIAELPIGEVFSEGADGLVRDASGKVFLYYPGFQPVKALHVGLESLALYRSGIATQDTPDLMPTLNLESDWYSYPRCRNLSARSAIFLNNIVKQADSQKDSNSVPKPCCD